MRARNSFSFLMILISASARIWTQQPATGSHTLGSISNSTLLPNGVRIDTSTGGVEEIVALRDDAVRVRIARGRNLPEDASWAVSPETRRSSVAVVADN